MLFKKTSEHKSIRPYLIITVGALAMVGAYSIMRCGKKMVKCTCEKMTTMMKQVVGREECSITEQ